MSDMTVDDLRANADLPPLEGPARTAESLLLLLHFEVDWNVWGGHRRVRYWDALTDYTRMATYAGPTLNDWWARATLKISSGTPTNKGLRAELAQLLGEPAAPVLDVLRRHTDALVLRVRVIADTKRVARAEREEADQGSLL